VIRFGSAQRHLNELNDRYHVGNAAATGRLRGHKSSSELRDAARVYAGENQSFRIEAGGQTNVPGGAGFAIVDLKACQ
jgi:hypothetical protein